MRRLIEAETAKEILSQVRIGYSVKEVAITEALGRVSAEDVFSPINIPPFRRSTRDGFAVISEDVSLASESSPVKLEVVGKVDAGEGTSLKIGRGQAVEISTGAVMPENADAVVMVENARVEGNVVWVKKGVSPKENVMSAGSDVQEGEVLVRAGEVIDTLKLGLLAGAGYGRVKVREMRVGIISTGNELTMPGEELEAGKIYDVNTYTIYAELKKLGATPVIYGIARDDREEMEDILEKALSECDAVITSGSTSAGKGDILYRIVEEKGEMVFHGVRVKPGKPFFFARVDEKPVFGLPGFPTSCLTIFLEFVAPAVARSLGYRIRRRVVRGRLAKRIYSEGRRELMPVFVVGNRIYPVEKGSGAITSLSEASGYMEIEEGEEIIERGSEREVRLFGKVYDYAFAGIDVFDLLELDAEVKGMYMSPELALLEFSRQSVDGVFYPDGEFEFGLVFAGKKGKTGAVSGYGVSADFLAKNHAQLVNLFRLGRLDGIYLLRPFAERFGIDGEEVGEVGIGFRSTPELEGVIGDQLRRLSR
ncbi:molybdenum cofactor synthesis domain [Geoglobus ahangari]|uniref:molybdopterin molybdotransferase n=1 Tax=Geoglobus ahangari TaxID=113653 RepID=A0A0F7IFC5_9EURY|nr:gephyrin-like molybdotransferase Glp [Geoglobus ahangari]AKG91485.1 molybdenum cofactor synthesis domain [Geoglobus ahangari]